MNAVIIHDYDPSWPQIFAALRLRIADVLHGLEAAIEHVGSTAVPGLAAKPIIDVDILLRSHTDLPLVIAKLTSLGYEHQGDLGIVGREAFRTPPGDFPHHLYVCLPDNDEYRRHLTFRNHLRSHATDASAYAKLKYELADKFMQDRNAYTEAKGAFVTEILRRADRLN
jgi:GrpB-like predicted nucleotidyltransferase (UPF0157 family)